MIYDFWSIGLIVLSSIIFVLFLVGVVHKDGSGLCILMFAAGCFTLMFGWIMYGAIANYGEGYMAKEVKLITTPTTIIATDNQNSPLITFTDVETYKMLSGKTNGILYRVVRTNMYKQPIWDGMWKTSPNQ